TRWPAWSNGPDCRSGPSSGVSRPRPATLRSTMYRPCGSRRRSSFWRRRASRPTRSRDRSDTRIRPSSGACSNVAPASRRHGTGNVSSRWPDATGCPRRAQRVGQCAHGKELREPAPLTATRREVTVPATAMAVSLHPRTPDRDVSSAPGPGPVPAPPRRPIPLAGAALVALVLGTLAEALLRLAWAGMVADLALVAYFAAVWRPLPWSGRLFLLTGAGMGFGAVLFAEPGWPLAADA